MERIAIISDIHGNIPALEAVLLDIENKGIKRIMCLGDLAGKGPDSDIAVDMIKDNCEIAVKGNWDYLMSEGDDSPMLSWHRKKLGKKRLDYLISLPIYVEFYMSGRLIRLCHAAPEDVFHRVQSTAAYEEKITLFKDPKGENKLSDIVGYGDIHGAYLDNFKEKTLFNVGSVGNPLDITQSSYAIIEGNYEDKNTSAFSISFVRVPYDIEKAVQKAKESAMPDMDEYINELRTARYRGRMKNETVEDMWQGYLKTIGEKSENTKKIYTSWCFGGTNDVADELSRLVLKGEKKATTSLYCLYDIDGDALPKAGDLSIVTDSNEAPKCIIETKKVIVIPFCNVTKDFAFKEGEGDKTLAYWKRVHINFFNEELKGLNKKFTEDMSVVCEEFEVVYIENEMKL